MGMRAAFRRGENMMEYARRVTQSEANRVLATLVSYDLQTGSYNTWSLAHPEEQLRWNAEVQALLNPLLEEGGSVLEVGSGEATTLAGFLQGVTAPKVRAFGFDVSWSRCFHGREWLARQGGSSAHLFVADLFDIPLGDESIDVVYTAHSLEPNGGREEEAIRELLRVARRAVVLIEPIYELVSPEVQARMRHHGYVRELKETAERLGATVSDYRMMPRPPTPNNPSGIVVLRKDGSSQSAEVGRPTEVRWRCPLTNTPLTDVGDAYYSAETGIAYPILRGIPLLRAEHAIVASYLPKAARVEATPACDRRGIGRAGGLSLFHGARSQTCL